MEEAVDEHGVPISPGAIPVAVMWAFFAYTGAGADFWLALVSGLGGTLVMAAGTALGVGLFGELLTRRHPTSVAWWVVAALTGVYWLSTLPLWAAVVLLVMSGVAGGLMWRREASLPVRRSQPGAASLAEAVVSIDALPSSLRGLVERARSARRAIGRQAVVLDESGLGAVSTLDEIDEQVRLVEQGAARLTDLEHLGRGREDVAAARQRGLTRLTRMVEGLEEAALEVLKLAEGIAHASEADMASQTAALNRALRELRSLELDQP